MSSLQRSVVHLSCIFVCVVRELTARSIRYLSYVFVFRKRDSVASTYIYHDRKASFVFLYQLLLLACTHETCHVIGKITTLNKLLRPTKNVQILLNFGCI